MITPIKVNFTGKYMKLYVSAFLLFTAKISSFEQFLVRIILDICFIIVLRL